MTSISILEARRSQIHRKGGEPFDMTCGKHSLAGSVSQRACVFCGSRVVLYPIADALHLIHGPIGCAAYTWDIRGALSYGPELHRMSFSTDLRERDVIFGGEKNLAAALGKLIDAYRPKAAFVYSTCIVGIIGDDVAAVCRKVEKEKGPWNGRSISSKSGPIFSSAVSRNVRSPSIWASGFATTTTNAKSRWPVSIPPCGTGSRRPEWYSARGKKWPSCACWTQRAWMNWRPASGHGGRRVRGDP